MSTVMPWATKPSVTAAEVVVRPGPRRPRTQLRPQFLDEAVRTANEQCADALGVNLVTHPRTIAALGPALGEAIAELRYGTAALNGWTGGLLSHRDPT
ncbi:hypothetical protein ACFRFU_38135 [Streptomyces sp. NPDC056704]|uniref:hypothetical protein n=1 Tax=Streptomyces sp. NPDC056704 TaxID=3345917 RepID=UPI0036AB9338